MRVAAPILVRDATIEDAASIGEVHAKAWRAAHRDLFEHHLLDVFVERRRQQWPSRMAAAGFDGSTLLVAVRKDRVVAFVHFGPHRIRRQDGEIYDCFVHPNVWGTGVSHTLLDSAWDQLVDSGYPAVRLWTLAGANRARCFYQRFGFQKSGMTREWDFGDGRPVLEIEYVRPTQVP